MQKNLFSLIQQYEKQFTNAEKKVAVFIRAHAGEALNMTITELAENCEVGDTTVFRFCKTLKLNGYQDFKMLLAQTVAQDTSSAITLSDSIQVEDTLEEVVQKLCGDDVNALIQTRDSIAPEKIRRVIGLMEKARLIYFIGSGSSGMIAHMAQAKFARILPNTLFELDAHIQLMKVSILDERDMVIAFSYSGSTIDTLENMRRAKGRNVHTVCISHYPSSPITEYSDIMLLYQAREGPFQGGSFLTAIPQLYLVDVLYTEFFKANYNLCSEYKKLTSESISGKML